MIISETGIYIGIIVIVGAMIVAVAARLVMESTSKKGIAQTEKQPVNPVENIGASATMRKRRASIVGLVLNKLRLLLKSVPRERSQRRRNVDPDQQPVDKGIAINEQFSTPLPGVTSLKPEIDTAPSSPDQQPVDKGIAINEQFSTPLPGVTSSESGINAAPSFPDQGVPNVEPANKEEPEVNTLSTLPAELAESSQDLPQEEPAEVSAASDDEYREQPKSTDSVFDLFTSDMAEESDVSKFAANLNDVDVHDLSGEAQDFINRLKGAKG